VILPNSGGVETLTTPAFHLSPGYEDLLHSYGFFGSSPNELFVPFRWELLAFAFPRGEERIAMILFLNGTKRSKFFQIEKNIF
jgi:hypothetical protein